jgi:sugar transferase (PEP-CTERM/EpsH1 system associated)
MRILWIKTELLHPVDKGGRIRTYQMLRALRREHHVTYLTLDDGSAAPDAVERSSEYCHELIRVPFTPAPRSGPRFFAALARNLVSRLPYAVARYDVPAMREAIEQVVRAGEVDVVVCDFLMPSVNVPRDLGVPTVLFQHNVEAMIWQRHAEVAGNAVKRAYMTEQWRRMVRHERDECQRFDHVVAVSAQDAEMFRRDFGVRSVSDVPTGVDTDYFVPVPRATTRSHELVFTGSMDWLPNEDAIRWFAAEILPRVRARVPDATLTVVGRHPPPSIRALDGVGGITVTGSVPDVRPYIARAAAFVVPIRIGGGTRLKIYEAMAMERLVVSTPIGAEGLPLRDGVAVVLAESADAFADAVVQALEDPARADVIAAEGGRIVRERYGWDRVARQFAEQCEATARFPTAPAERVAVEALT